jgi:hypothetical protein
MSNTREINKYTPAYEPVSLREPSEKEKEIDATLKGLKKYCNVQFLTLSCLLSIHG